MFRRNYSERNRRCLLMITGRVSSEQKLNHYLKIVQGTNNGGVIKERRTFPLSVITRVVTLAYSQATPY